MIELAGSQHKVMANDSLVINILKPLCKQKVGSAHAFADNVMLVRSSHLTLVGMAHASGSEADVMVEEIAQDAKVIVFKKCRGKNHKRKDGHRCEVMCLRVLDIQPPTEHANANMCNKKILPLRRNYHAKYKTT